MNALTPELERQQDELIEKRNISGCVSFLRDNENADEKRIAEFVFEDGDSWDCVRTLMYGKGLEPEITNKLALRVAEYGYKHGDSWGCTLTLKYAKGLYPDTIKKLKAVK